MKAIRTLAAALAVVTLVPAVGMAQTARPFQNSWFWGIKGGGTFVSSPSKSNVTSGMAGIDWLITRQRGGLYVSLDQSFLSQYAVLADSVNSTDTPSRVNLKNMRRLTVAIMGYPGDWVRFHPYAGLGMTYSTVGQITPQTAYTSQDQYTLAQQIIAQYKSVFSPTLLLGAQFQVRNAAVFVQGMGWQANQNFFLSSSTHGFNASIEAGLRYNFGSSVEQDR
ncbi:MAG: hypothetical protein KGL93_13485 [Gemmatimonadota bacterium]|nr:hypothetical protein [Gemmatimonadota bacterium]HEU4990105.1 hypothetical protein [Gemmatimonadaceae bacterium]